MTFSLTIESAAEIRAAETAKQSAELTALIDAHVEAQARALGYNSAASCAGYAASTVEVWAEEAQAFVSWRDAVWQQAYRFHDAGEAEGTIPGPDAVLAALPAWSS